MKLVEILAREMDEWPEGCFEAHQSGFDLEVYLDGSDEFFFASEAADDRGLDKRGVTRSMWEDERARIGNPKSETECSSWGGEGLPKSGDMVDAPINGARYVCEVIAVEGDDIAVRMPGAIRIVDISEIRAIRTQERIAAEERDTVYRGMVEDLSEAIGISNIDKLECDVLHALSEAGYRKQDQQK